MNAQIEGYRRQLEMGDVPRTYQGLVGFMRNLRTNFIKKYPVDYSIGSLYTGEMTITYFPFTPKTLKEQKLKIAIVFDHRKMRFEIWLAGQNRQIQKKYREIFKCSDWNKYHIPSTQSEGFSIVDSVMVENPNFDDLDALTNQIETKTMEFINEMKNVLE